MSTLTPQELNVRRAKIVRRWAAYRVSLAQRAIWRKRRVRAGWADAETETDENADRADRDLLAELSDDLLG